MTDETILKNSEEIWTIMRGALEAALRAARDPLWALSGLNLATQALLAVFSKEAPEHDWTELFVPGNSDLGAAIVETELRRHRAMMPLNQGAAQQIAFTATECVEAIRDRATTLEETILVLTVARHIALALLRRQYPERESYEAAYTDIRAMENAMRPEKIRVEDAGVPVAMSKGGDA
jgi:hypothetical protein